MSARFWTEDQDRRILSSTDDVEISRELGRSVNAIRLRRWKVKTGRAYNGAPTGRPKNTIEDVWKYVQMGAEDDCWPWIAATRRRGYGVFSVNRKDHVASRLVFQVSTGIDPGELLVCHTCDNPPCCNPAHLFLGTHTDNVRDMLAKGRGRWSIA